MFKYYRYYVIDCNGFQGCTYYETEEEAQAAATFRNNLHGKQYWTVREVWLNDSYAADNRPYITRNF